jgi:hypothetical protein
MLIFMDLHGNKVETPVSMAYTEHPTNLAPERRELRARLEKKKLPRLCSYQGSNVRHLASHVLYLMQSKRSLPVTNFFLLKQ